MSDGAVKELSSAEREVIAAAESGMWADFSQAPDHERPTIPAHFLRKLLLGFPVVSETAGERPCRIAAPGLRIRAARIKGELDLVDCIGSAGASLGVLALEDCEIPEELNLTNARLARLSLKGSRIGQVSLRGAHLAGPFDFSGVAPVTGPNYAPAWIDAHNAVVRGTVTGRGAKLHAPPSRVPEDILPGTHRYALRLSDTEIDGSVDLNDYMEAIGGISFSGADIRGDLLTSNTELKAGEADAFNAQSMTISGVVVFEKLKAHGRIWMLGAKISGSLLCRNVHLINREVGGIGHALVADRAEIGGGVVIRRGTTAEGMISFVGAKIGADFSCSDIHLANRTRNGEGIALEATNAEIGGTMYLRNLTAEGRISILNAKLYAVSCTDCVLRNESRDVWGTLNLSGAKINRGVLFKNVVSIGSVWLVGSNIGGALTCWDAKFLCPGELPRISSHAFDATNSSVGQGIILDSVSVIGTLTFEHAEIAGNIKWSSLRFPRSVDVLAPVLWKGRVRQVRACWSYYGRVRKTQALDSSWRARSFGTNSSPVARLVLAHAHIDAALQAHSLEAEIPLLIDLSAARAYTLDDVGDAADDIQDEVGKATDALPRAFPAGWGGSGSVAPALDLDGFVYQRIEHFPSDARSQLGVPLWLRWLFKLLIRLLAIPGRLIATLLVPLRNTRVGRFGTRLCSRVIRWVKSGENIAEPRLSWIRRQHKKREGDFFPQPYRHLANVLRAQGHIEAAREVAIAERRASHYSPWGQLWRAPFGLCFGYGLKPLNATVTLLATLAVGTFMVWLAWQNPFASPRPDTAMSILILTADQESAVAAEQQLLSITDKAMEKILARRLAENMIEEDGRRCGRLDIVPILYALDMMIPVIQLNQVNRCEIARRRDTLTWQTAWALFSIFGKIVTTLALITYSGVLKPKDE